MPRLCVLLLFLTTPLLAQTQNPTLAWNMQTSGTTAGLRGIDSVDGKTAWASGTGGTVLKTTDGGQHWTPCTIPDAGKDGATLDFRGIQAWDEKSAIVMASGPGDKSRLYKTTDGCKSWTLELRNSEEDGFWDVLIHPRETYGDAKVPNDYTFLAGDPIHGHFDTWEGYPISHADIWRHTLSTCTAASGSAIFAASNSSATVSGFESYFLAFGGKSGSQVLISPFQQFNSKAPCKTIALPIAGGTESSGAFSLAFQDHTVPWIGIAVGGDYTKPNDPTGTAAWSTDGGQHWTASTTPPHGYRSSVAWSPDLKAWITAGTNGSDISFDDGKTWQPIDNGNWNALSLPFVVGPKGRIARLSVANPASKQ